MYYTTLEEMLADAAQDPETFEQADRMYSAMFRSECAFASDIFTCTDKEWEDYYFNPDDILVCLCNYKGEGESDWLLLTDELKKLPVYVSKEASWGRA
jgi:hypothetical protein